MQQLYNNNPFTKHTVQLGQLIQFTLVLLVQLLRLVWFRFMVHLQQQAQLLQLF
jgi:hypothetical protein